MKSDQNRKLKNPAGNRKRAIQKPEGRPKRIKPIRYLFDVSLLDEDTAKNLGKYMDRQYPADEVFVLCAWENGWANGYFKTDTCFCLFISYMNNGILYPSARIFIEENKFYSMEKEYFFSKLFTRNPPMEHIIRTACALDEAAWERIKNCIWDGMMQVFPQYESKKHLPAPDYEKYLPFALDDVIGAEKYHDAGILFRAFKPIGEDGTLRTDSWIVYHYGKPNEERVHAAFNPFGPTVKDENEFNQQAQIAFEDFLTRYLLKIPCKSIAVDDYEMGGHKPMGASGVSRVLHIFPSKGQKCYLVVQVHQEYYGHPMEGGYMANTRYTLQQIPSEHYNMSREELIKTYIPAL